MPAMGALAGLSAGQPGSTPLRFAEPRAGSPPFGLRSLARALISHEPDQHSANAYARNDLFLPASERGDH